MPKLFLIALSFCLLDLALLRAEEIQSFQFLWREGEKQRPLRVYWNQTQMRIDTPEQNFSVLYDCRTEEFTGLEHRDAKYWQFNWLKLKKNVENSRRNSARLKSPLVVEPSPNADPVPVNFQWKASQSRKTVAELPVELWECRDANERRVRLWFSPLEAKPSVEFWRTLHFVQETMKLIAVRSLGPSLPTVAWDHWLVAQGSPLELTLGDSEESQSLTLRTRATLPEDPALFLPPPTYRLNPLSAIAGLE
jgi:hypothetical protein